MTWIWMLPVLLTVTLSVLFQPLFSRRGQRPLPQGVEGNPWTELHQQRERLLRQLKEWQLEEGGQPGERAEAASMERELAVVLARLDQLGEAPQVKGAEVFPEGYNPVDVGFATAVLVLLAALSGGLYLGLGKGMTPTAASVEKASGMAAHVPSEEEIRAAVARLAQRLQQEPDNIPGWLHLARSQATLGNLPDAVQAYTHVLSRQQDNVDAAVGLAELQMQSGVESQIKQGLATLERVLAKQGDQPEALWLIGAVMARTGDMVRAVELWKRLLPLLAEGSEARSVVEMAIQEAQGQRLGQ
ncbi:MAG: hypothetical protein HQL88_11125 [Magnetococcales bacterium]|nr:hypothetical protein [Magnetococcales bacterium]